MAKRRARVSLLHLDLRQAVLLPITGNAFTIALQDISVMQPYGKVLLKIGHLLERGVKSRNFDVPKYNLHPRANSRASTVRVYY